jgi:hypothetical protein
MLAAEASQECKVCYSCVVCKMQRSRAQPTTKAGGCTSTLGPRASVGHQSRHQDAAPQGLEALLAPWLWVGWLLAPPLRPRPRLLPRQLLLRTPIAAPPGGARERLLLLPLLLTPAPPPHHPPAAKPTRLRHARQAWDQGSAGERQAERSAPGRARRLHRHALQPAGMAGSCVGRGRWGGRARRLLQCCGVRGRRGCVLLGLGNPRPRGYPPLTRRM